MVGTWSVAVPPGSSGTANTRPSRSCAPISTSPLSARSSPGKPYSSGTRRSRPSSAYVQPWNGHVRDWAQPVPSTSCVPRWRHEFLNTRTRRLTVAHGDERDAGRGSGDEAPGSVEEGARTERRRTTTQELHFGLEPSGRPVVDDRLAPHVRRPDRSCRVRCDPGGGRSTLRHRDIGRPRRVGVRRSRVRGLRRRRGVHRLIVSEHDRHRSSNCNARFLRSVTRSTASPMYPRNDRP